MKPKILLHQFDPVIYPFKIWIVITNEFQNILDDYFLDYTTGENISFSKDVKDKTDAVTFAVRKKDTKEYGCVIMFRSRQMITMSLAAHESSHAAKDLFNHIGAEVEHHEPFEYLLGWIVDCCEQVKKNKFK